MERFKEWLKINEVSGIGIGTEDWSDEQNVNKLTNGSPYKARGLRGYNGEGGKLAITCMNSETKKSKKRSK